MQRDLLARVGTYRGGEGLFKRRRLARAFDRRMAAIEQEYGTERLRKILDDVKFMPEGDNVGLHAKYELNDFSKVAEDHGLDIPERIARRGRTGSWGFEFGQINKLGSWHGNEFAHYIISHPKINPNKLSRHLENLINYGTCYGPGLKYVLDYHEKITPHNIRAVKEAIERGMELPDDEKEMSRRLGRLDPLLEHPLISERNLNTWVYPFNKDPDATLELLNDPKTAEHFDALGELFGPYGSHPKEVLELWRHPHTNGDNIVHIMKSIGEGITVERAKRLLDYDWRDIADGRLDFASLTRADQLLLASKLVKSSSRQNIYRREHDGYEFNFSKMTSLLEHNKNIDHDADFQIDARVKIPVVGGSRIVRPKMNSALKLTPHFEKRPFEFQAASALLAAGHSEPFLHDIIHSRATQDDVDKLDAHLKKESIGSLDEKDRVKTIKQILHVSPDAFLPFTSEIANRVGVNLDDFGSRDDVAKFEIMNEYFSDVLPEFFSRHGLTLPKQASKLKDRFEKKTTGKTSARTVRLYSGRKTPLHALYSPMGQTCIHRYEKRGERAQDPRFSPISMFDAGNGEFLGSIYAQTEETPGGKAVVSFGFEPLRSFSDTVKNKDRFVRDVYSEVAKAASAQGMGTYALAGDGLVSNRGPLIDPIKKLGQHTSARLWGEKHKVICLSHLAKK